MQVQNILIGQYYVELIRFFKMPIKKMESKSLLALVMPAVQGSFCLGLELALSFTIEE